MRVLPLLTGGCVILCALRCQQPPAIVAVSLDTADDRWNGALPIADGAVHGAAHFDGDQSRIELGRCPVDSTKAFTLRCQLRTTSAAFATPLMARDGDAVGLSLVLGREPGCVSFEAWSWRDVRLLSPQRVDDGAWHAIEVSYDPTTNLAALFVDGQLRASDELGVGAAPTAQLRLGDNIGAHQPFAGDLDEISVAATTTHHEQLSSTAPVLPRAAREAALQQLRHHALPTVTPSLDAAAFASWPARRLAVRQHVADALGLSPPPDDVPLDVQVHGELVRDGVRVQRISWIGFPGHRATGWLWSPEQAPTTRQPAILCPHGHWQDGARHPVVQARCAAFAHFGWIALAVDSVHVEDVASGVNAVGAMTWHNQRAISLLLARDDVDGARIAVTGASGGAQQSYYLMALEDRLAAAAPMVMACYLTEIVTDTSAHCGCNHVPRLAAGTDVPEMCAVFAPRPAFFGSVTGDWTHNFPRQGLPELRQHWQRLGGTGPRSRHADEGHNYDQPMREEVYAFLTDVLVPDAQRAPRERIAEPPFRAFTADELQPLLRACPMLPLDAHTMAAAWLARRPRVDDWRTLAPGLDFSLPNTPIAWLEPANDGWRRGTVTGGDGVPIPLRTRAEPDRGPFTVVVDPAGASSACLQMPAWLAKGRRLVFVDPRPYGEWSRYRASWQRNGILLGRGEGYQAALDVARVCSSLPGDEPVTLFGRGEAGVVALLAAQLCPRITQLLVEDLGPTFAHDGNRQPLCPELLRYGDLDTLQRALPATCRLQLVGSDGPR